MSTSISIHVCVSLLLLLLLLLHIVCFASFGNCSTFTVGDDSATMSSTTASRKSNYSNVEVEPNINIAFLSIRNDLPPGSQRLYFISSFQATEYRLEPGQTYHKMSNVAVQDCEMLWDPLCAKFNVYDPRVDLGHPKVYCSVRKDGIYHSWDDAIWDKKANWHLQSAGGC